MSKDYYKPEEIPKFHEKFFELGRQYEALKMRFATHKFGTTQGREHALHGYLRRNKILRRCVKKVFKLIPPELENNPGQDEVTDGTVYLHAFYVNVFGACDNLAWLIVSEKKIKKTDEVDLPASWVGIRKDNKRVREMLSYELNSVLDKFEGWFDHVDSFRHSLAHRIPLYVPPYVVEESKFDDYERLERESWDALRGRDIKKSKALKEEQMELVNFRPWFTHSFSENSPQMVIHPQLLADFGALLELGEAVIKEVE